MSGSGNPIGIKGKTKIISIDLKAKSITLSPVPKEYLLVAETIPEGADVDYSLLFVPPDPHHLGSDGEDVEHEQKS